MRVIGGQGFQKGDEDCAFLARQLRRPDERGFGLADDAALYVMA
jgi:hypothetical protein